MAVRFEEFIDELHTALRLTGADFDISSLQPMMNACLVDMRGAGVDTASTKNEPLIRQAIIFYCRANFGLTADEKWQKRYEDIRDALGSRRAEVTE